MDIQSEIIVSDSSTDSSPEIAKKHNVILVKHDKKGYGIAYLEGIKKSKGKYLFFADPDGSYGFKEIPTFLNALKNGNDFVIGNRFAGIMEPDSMPWLHKHIGNPILSFILRLFYKGGIKDAHCGMRAIHRDKLDELKLKTVGMEFASEMIVKAIKHGLKIEQLPIHYYKRKGKSKLNTFADGWRHFRFLLLFSPLFLFFIPGLISFIAGFLTLLWLYFGNPTILGITLYFHPMFFSSLLIIIGYQLIIFSVFAKTYAIHHLGEKSQMMKKITHFMTIEKAGMVGIFFGVFGVVIYLSITVKWVQSGFGALNEIKNSIVALTLIVIGIQTVFSSFMISILGIEEK
jgi:glycosyltransferase involved in cell wall biosynthesis